MNNYQLTEGSEANLLLRGCTEKLALRRRRRRRMPTDAAEQRGICGSKSASPPLRGSSCVGAEVLNIAKSALRIVKMHKNRLYNRTYTVKATIFFGVS